MARMSNPYASALSVVVIIAVAAALLLRAAPGSGGTAAAANPPLYIALDCDTATAGVQDTCNVTLGSVATMDAGVFIGNETGSSQTLAGFNFDVYDSDITLINPNSAPTRDAASLTAAGWTCSSPAPLADTGLGAAGTATSFLSCFISAGSPDTLVSSLTPRSMGFTHYAVTAAAPGTATLILSNVSAVDDFAVTLVTCDPAAVPPATPVVTGPCFNATVNFVSPTPTFTPTATDTPLPPTDTPTATSTPTITPTPSIPDTDGDGLDDNEEALLGTNPTNADTDGDGLNDGQEVHTTLTDPLRSDTDGDGLTDGAEVNTTSTNPLIADSDGDGLSDGTEVNITLSNPNNVDSDGDGIHDGAEVVTFHTNPNSADSDGDGLGDLQEVVIGSDPNVADTDGDGLSDGAEVLTHLTSPLLADTDGDLLSDAAEVNTTLTDPRVADTDHDGLNDGYEVTISLTNPNNADTDGDGVTDGAEVNTYHSNPQLPDTDSDTMPDGFEVLNFCLNVLVSDAVADPDLDFVGNVAELAQGTLPCNPDTDGDGFRDKIGTSHAHNNPNPFEDNCILIANPGQINTDGEFIDLPPAIPFDDLTQPRSDAIGDPCDSDADNDGIANTAEVAGAPCATASGPTNPLLLDTDGDNVNDIAECLLSTNPVSAASTPPYAPAFDTDHDGLVDGIEGLLGTSIVNPDSDGDRILDGVEYKYYGSNPLSVDTEPDGCADGKEIASLNGDRKVDSTDMLLTAQHFGNAGSPAYMVELDVNKDGKINTTDQLIQAKVFGPC